MLPAVVARPPARRQGRAHRRRLAQLRAGPARDHVAVQRPQQLHAVARRPHGGVPRLRSGDARSRILATECATTSSPASIAPGAPARDLLVVSLRDDLEVAPRPYPTAAWFEGMTDAADPPRPEAVRRRRRCRSTTSAPGGSPTDLGAELRRLESTSAATPRRRRDCARSTAARRSPRATGCTSSSRRSPRARPRSDCSSTTPTRSRGTSRRSGSTTSPSTRPDCRPTEIARSGHRRSREHRDRAGRGAPDGEAPAARSSAPSCTSVLGGVARRREGGRRDDARPRVYHVGRAGDIPGGMTQVVNAYLSWPFEHVTVHVIESRGDPGDHVTALRRCHARAPRGPGDRPAPGGRRDRRAPLGAGFVRARRRDRAVRRTPRPAGRSPTCTAASSPCTRRRIPDRSIAC